MVYYRFNAVGTTDVFNRESTSIQAHTLFLFAQPTAVLLSQCNDLGELLREVKERSSPMWGVFVDNKRDSLLE